jgi:Na+-translocating ferredoxin:NAD+ oxidoreductase subunit G
MADHRQQPRLLHTLLMVVIVATGAALLVTASHELSHERIAENQRLRLQAHLNTVLPADLHDNLLTTARFQVIDAQRLGTASPVDVYLAVLDGEPVAVLINSSAPDGYNAPIRLLVGILADGTISGVRVTDHRETPGLGDPIEADKSDWILQFDGTRLDDPSREDWATARDGGAFDGLTGATITPRAVIRAVRNTLVYFEENRDSLFAQGLALIEAETATEAGNDRE